MQWFPHHHPACFCWVCRHDKPGHPSDRCHCERCLGEWTAIQKHLGQGEMVPQRISAAQWEHVSPHVKVLQDAGYYISPVGEIEGDVYVEVEAEAVEMWKELVTP